MRCRGRLRPPKKGALGRPFSCALLILLTATPVARAAPADCAPPAHAETAAVRYVIDGDTIILAGGRHLRIIGLNAPELGHHGSADQAYARAARRRLQAALAIAGNHIAWVAGQQRHDHYGRTLGRVYAGGDDVARELLAAGLAALIAIPPNVARIACYHAAEAQARQAHRGIWSAASPLLQRADTAAALTPGFELLSGRVRRVQTLRAGTRLTLAQHITIWIPAADRHFFAADLRALAHHYVLVRGWLHRYHGRPEIVVHHPAALTPLAAPRGS